MPGHKSYHLMETKGPRGGREGVSVDSSSRSTREICPHMPTCALHADLSQSTSGFWRAMYCEANFKKCARFAYKDMGRSVPKDLLPNGKRSRSQSPRF